jgi:hypothetical protein
MAGRDHSSHRGSRHPALAQGAAPRVVVVQARIHTPMAQDTVSLIKARTMLIVLLATCQQSEHSIAAADYAIDLELANDLRRLISRLEREVASMNSKLT